MFKKNPEPEFIATYSKEQSIARKITKKTEGITDKKEKERIIIGILFRMKKFQDDILHDKFMKNEVYKPYCERCGKKFDEHKKLYKVMQHKDYGVECYYPGKVDCEKCKESNPKGYEICRSKLKCICSDCNYEIYKIQGEIWEGNYEE